MSRDLDAVELKDWTFDELVSAATWQVLHGLTRGEPLRTSIYGAMRLAMNWTNERKKPAPTTDTPGQG